ncbi:MAG: type II toxin-antitoxin system HicB family antitoxin [Actinobacteria bacterium]|nr:type II toxin-antitoxin system HicB family antitoxin [Actinomycetota bacterium]
MRNYAINVFWSDEDECYIATVPDLKGCSAFGDTAEAAVREVEVAKRLWLEVAAEDGDEIPEPRYLPPGAQQTAAG